MKKYFIGFVALMISFVASGTHSWAQLKHEKLVDGIVAVVGSDIVLLSELKTQQAVRSGRFQKKKWTRKEVLNELIEEKLLKQELDRLGIQASPEAVQRMLHSVLAQNRITLPQLKKELAAKGISFGTYKKRLGERIRMMAFMRQVIFSKVTVGAEDLETYRRRYPHKSKQQSEEKIREIVMDTKAGEMLQQYLRGVRERSYVEIRNVQ